MENKFGLGQLVATCGISERTQEDVAFRVFVINSIKRHHCGDWGDLCDEDKETNEYALKNGDRLFSAYKFTDGTKIWIITEWDRSVTTVLFPDEY